jgi:metal-responsive CopG/Arc/MetJ family transcriptional regulator
MEQKLIDALDRHAERQKTSRSQVAAEALRKLLRIR